MGQSPSTAVVLSRRDSNPSHRRSKSKSSSIISPSLPDDLNFSEYCNLNPNPNPSSFLSSSSSSSDGISDLPDECLACIFQFLSSGDRKRCSLVCHRWFTIEGQSRHRLSLNAQSDLLLMIPALFARFDSVTKLALKCDRKSVSIGDDALVMISLRCRNLTRLKLRSCRDITDAGIAAFAINCKGLKKLSCGSCAFGARGMNAVLDNCALLEELSVKRLRGLIDGAGAAPEHIGPGAAAASLKTICLKELYNADSFGPLLIGSKNLKTLKLVKCSSDWDKLLERIMDRVTGIVEIHLERLQVSDLGLVAISNCTDLDILHLVRTPGCTNLGLVAIAERCKVLRKLHIDGGKENRIGDDGLTAVAKHCPNLQELVLMGVNPTNLSLDLLATNCQKLERLAFVGSDTVGDAEITCIAAKCVALKKLCIKNCPISNKGIEALANGCPNLVKVKVKKCRGVTYAAADQLRASRESLALNLDAVEQEQPDASVSDEAPENGIEFPPIISQGPSMASASASSSGTSRSPSFKLRLGVLSGKSLVACAFRRWSSGSGSGGSGSNSRSA